jgi:chromosome segregation ATPase
VPPSRSSPVILVLFASGLFACTIAQLREDVSQREVRVQAKDSELKTEEGKQVALRDAMKRLEEDLSARQMSLDDLQSRLDQLQRASEALDATTAQQRARKQHLSQQLDRYRTELRSLQQSADISVDEKRKKLDQLKLEIRKALELLAQS